MEYNNIAIDERGFLFVTTSAIGDHLIFSAIEAKINDTNFSPVKKLNPAGVDVMARNGPQPIVGDVSIPMGDRRNPIYGPSIIADVAYAHSGIFTLLDVRRNKVFTYSNQGELLFAFGGAGMQEGILSTPVSIAYKGDDFLILDKSTGRLNLYKQTEYGAMVFDAIRYYVNRDYTKSTEMWLNVMDANTNFDLAYVGHGRSKMLAMEYKEAMDSFKKSSNLTQYSNAFREYRKIYIEENLIWILPLAAALLILLRIVGKKCKRINEDKEIPNNKRKKYLKDISYAMYVIFHPFNGFWDIKNENRGSASGAVTILFASVLTTGFSFVGSGFLNSPNNYNIGALVMAAMTICAPLLIWCLANWCLTSLMDGEGTMVDVFVTTCYALTPYVIMLFFTTILSNFLVLEEMFIITFFNGVAMIWSFLLIFFGMITIHNYTLIKNISVTVLSLAGMIVITFLGTLFIDLVGNMYGYFTSLYKEIMFRL